MLERAPEKSRNLHLRHAYPRRDLGLREILDEPQANDDAFPFVQLLERPRERRVKLDALIALVVRAERLDE